MPSRAESAPNFRAISAAFSVQLADQQRHKGTLFFLLVFLLVLSARNKLESSINAGFKAFFDSLRRTSARWHTNLSFSKPAWPAARAGFCLLHALFCLTCQHRPLVSVFVSVSVSASAMRLQGV